MQNSARILIVYGSTHGQTAKVVDHVARALGEAGHHVTAWPGDVFPASASLDDFDGFVIAGSVYFGKHQRYLAEFVRRHAARLNRLPSAFVSVCGALAGAWEPGPAEARKYVGQFLAATGWKPRRTQSFAGAVQYTKYRWPIRWVMKLISWRTGRPTDTSRDWDFSDWEAVDRFGRELAGELFGAASPSSAAAPELEVRPTEAR